MTVGLMVVLDWSVWFSLAYVFEIPGPQPFVLLHRVFDVLCLHTRSRLSVIIVLPSLSCVP